MINDSEVIQHLSPVWQYKANSLIHVHIDDDLPKKFDQLWVNQLEDGCYQICCIPFAIYDLSLCDHVEILFHLEKTGGIYDQT
jgi:hypothetical protein